MCASVVVCSATTGQAQPTIEARCPQSILGSLSSLFQFSHGKCAHWPRNVASWLQATWASTRFVARALRIQRFCRVRQIVGGTPDQTREWGTSSTGRFSCSRQPQVRRALPAAFEEARGLCAHDLTPAGEVNAAFGAWGVARAKASKHT